MEDLKKIFREKGFFLGITGGIASGKSTVSGMLEEMGASLIDYDILARQAVEPETPAWRDIVGFFGKVVLFEDDTIDRKKLSEIVFREPEKRKALERFIHPRVDEECLRRVRALIQKDPHAIIQVSIPLMMERGDQSFFHKVILVYIPKDLQIERLIRRDGIAREQAESILHAQMPIDEKVKFADFVIRNEGRLEETRKQVEKVWETLKRNREERMRGGLYEIATNS